jgi:UDP-N-acetylglucosamine--N-acetylmuramyl-(pentapeptide) pyrophosphoryl-undecaprenol N-acetylglucosamine transferase
MAGGTGGHVFPALAVAKYLRDQGWSVSWLGTQQGLEAEIIPRHQFEIDWLSVSGLRGKGVIAKFKSLFFLVKACGQAFIILRRCQPNVVLGMGGFVAAPGGLMATLLKIPLVIHEQNRVVGTSNRLLSSMATRLLEAFPNSFPSHRQALTTGNPLRQDFMQLITRTERQKNQPLKLLIIGGSQGAQFLNEQIPPALALLANINVKHQTGAVMQQQVETNYQSFNITAQVFAFVDDMPKLYQWADLIICRAGAMTVSEVAACGLPAIFIPLPHAIDDHQSANAHYLVDDNAALILPQQQFTPTRLIAAITQIENHLETMAIAAKNKAQLAATATVAHICTEVATQ